MIDVRKYKLDDESNDEDSLVASQSFKGKYNTKENINFFNRNPILNKNADKSENFPNFKKNDNNIDESNRELAKNYFHNNYKYLVDDSQSKINNENESDLLKSNQNQNNKEKQNNFLLNSNNEELFNKSIDKADRKKYNIPNKINKGSELLSDEFNNLNFIDSQTNKKYEENVFEKSHIQRNHEEFDSSNNKRTFNEIDDDISNNYLKNQNFHHIQIIDEDVENFKRKIDILVKNFKTDSLKDFMGIKRHLLIEQKNSIESEKQKCDAMLGAKTDQIEHLKDNLQKCQNALNKETEIKEKISLYLYNFKKIAKNKVLKTSVFGEIKNYYIRKKNNKRITNKIRHLLMKHLKERGFRLLDRNRLESKTFNTILAKENEFKNKLNEMGQFYGKEISDLKEKLNEANASIEKYKENKTYLQENLKRALMRGVVAMNLEAMNILEPDSDKSSNVMLNMATNIADMNYFNNKMSFTDVPLTNNKPDNITNMSNNINNSATKFTSERTEFNYNNKSDIADFNMNTSNLQPEILEKKNVVKDNKWINACSVPDKMKNNIIGNDIEEFEEKNFPIKVPINTNIPGSNRVIYNKNNFDNADSYPLDYADELNKNMNNLKSDFKNLVKTPQINPNFINNSYSNIIQNTDNSNINSVNYINLLNNQGKSNINNNSDYSNINYNLFKNNYNELENNSFEENNSISYNRPNNLVVRTNSINQANNGIVVNVKKTIQSQSKQEENIFNNNHQSNSGINAMYSSENNSFSPQQNSNNKKFVSHVSSSSVHNTNSNSVNNEKNKLTRKNSTSKIEKSIAPKNASVFQNKTENNRKKN